MSYVRASLLGAVDGVITSFAIVAGADALTSSVQTVLVVGSSSLLADGVSMGVSEFLSSTSEQVLQKNSTSPIVLGAVCFTSFVVCGFVPLCTYLVFESLLVTSALTLLELVLLGSVRTAFTHEQLLVALTQTTVLGVFAGSVAFGVGWISAQFL